MLFRVIFGVFVAGVSVVLGGAVNVIAISPAGDAVSAEIRLYELGSNKNLWPRGETQIANDIPSGYYRIEVIKPGYRSFHRELEVSNERADVRAVLTPSVETSGASTLHGKIVPVQDSAGMWVLAFPISGQPNDMTQAKVGKNGQFQITTGHAGSYLLAVVTGMKLLGTKEAYIGFQNSDVVIDLARQ
jgi:hypothetical protein